MRAWTMAYDLRTLAIRLIMLPLESADEVVEARSRDPEVAARESACESVLCSDGALEGTSMGGKLVPDHDFPT